MIPCSKTLAEEEKLREGTAGNIYRPRRYDKMSGDDQEPWMNIHTCSMVT